MLIKKRVFKEGFTWENITKLEIGKITDKKRIISQKCLI